MLRNKFYIQIIIFVSLVVSNTVYSQVVNIENKRIYDDTLGLSGSVESTLSTMKTKDLLLNLAFRPKIQFKTKNHYYLILTDLMYSKGGDKVYSNLGLIHFQYAYRIKGPLKWESYSQAQYNQLLDQKSRLIIGSGLRLKCFDKNKYKIFTGLSAFFEREEIESSRLIIEDVRLSEYISWYFDPKKHYFFSGVMYIQPMINNFKDIRVMGQYSINFHFTKRTDFKIEFTHFYGSRPAIGVINSTFNSSFGIRTKLGK
jgi:hypothetical protein